MGEVNRTDVTLLAVANPCLFVCLGFFVCLFLQYLQLCLRGRKVETVSHHIIPSNSS